MTEPDYALFGTDVARNPIDISHGHVSAPSGAGLGVEANEDLLAQYARSI